MLKNPQKADLDKDGKLSSYEKRRGKAIEANMMKAKTGKDIKIIEAVAKEPIIGSNKSKSAKTLGKTLGKEIKKKSIGGEMRGYGAARTSGMGLQDEQLAPGKSLDYYKDLM